METASQEDLEPEETIYSGGFETFNKDVPLFQKFHTSDWKGKFALLDKFKDDRLVTFGHSLIYNEAPEILPKDIYKKTFALLLKERPIFAGKYSLKNSIMELGPSGFLFEQYFAAILKEYGYRTRTNQMIGGMCATHEIDIVAEKDGVQYLIEAKYHNTRGIKSERSSLTWLKV